MNWLLATDFSPAAVAATHFALEWASQLNINLTVIHALNDKNISPDQSNSGLSALKTLLEEAYTEVAVEVHVVSDDPLTAIDTWAKTVDAQLIIMGATGNTSAEDSQQIGLTVSKFLEKTDKSVLVIPPKSKITALESITFAVDLLPLKDSMLNVLLMLSGKYQSKINLLHIFDLTKDFPSDKMAQANKLQQIFKPVPHEFYMKAGNDIVHAIHDFTKARKTDLLVLIARKYSLIESLFRKSVTNNVALSVDLPFLAIHE